MDNETTQHARVLLKILRHVALWNEESTWHHTLPPIVVSLAVHIPLTFTFTLLMWMDAVHSADLAEAMDVLYIAFTETAFSVKVISILFHMRLANSLFAVWRTHSNFRLRTPEERLMWEREFKAFDRVAFTYIIITYSVLACSFAALFFMPSYRLPFRYWTPFDQTRTPYYWYAFFYESLAMPLTCISNCAIDMWQCYLMQYLATCFGIIAMRLQNLGWRDSNGSGEEVRISLVQIIQFDQQVRRMCKQIEYMISYPILAQILLSALILCFSLYRLQHVHFLEDPGSYATLVQYAVVMTLQIFLPCYYANKLTYHSSLPVKSIFNCNWPAMSTSDRKMILAYMHFLNKPVILRAGNFFDIGLPIFNKTINNAYSFFALLLNMDME